MARRLKPNVRGLFEKYFLDSLDDNWVYQGIPNPAWDAYMYLCKGVTSLGTLECSRASMSPMADLRSLGNLEQVEGNLDLNMTNVTTTGNLVEVRGFLAIDDSLVTNAPKLKRVDWKLSVNTDMISCFENLELVGELELYAGVPFLPKIRKGVLVRFVNEIGRQKDEYYYDFVKQVKDMDATDLVPSRSTYPRLKHLIDARLRGDL